MADSVVPDSAPGSSTDQLAGMNLPEYNDYMRTGKLPASATLEDSPSSPAATGPEAEPAAPAAASEPAKTEAVESRSAKTARRFNELTSDRKRLAAENERLAAEIKTLREGKSPAVERPAAAAERVEAKPDEPKKSKLQERLAKAAEELSAGKYTKYEDYIADVGKITAEETFAERQALAQAEADKAKLESDQKAKEKEFADARAKILKSWQASIAEAKKIHKDFDEVFHKDLNIGPTEGLVETALLTSPVGTEIGYHLGKHKDELEAIMKMSPNQAALALAKLELRFTPQSSPVLKRETKAPEPPTELGGGALAPADEELNAVRNDDVAAFIAERNRKDLLRSKRG